MKTFDLLSDFEIKFAQLVLITSNWLQETSRNDMFCEQFQFEDETINVTNESCYKCIGDDKKPDPQGAGWGDHPK